MNEIDRKSKRTDIIKEKKWKNSSEVNQQ